jgi:hypothetical protein
VSPSITIIIVPAEDPDTFEAMYLDERRHRSGGWTCFSVRSGRYLDTFLMKATDSDLGVFASADDVDSAGEKLVSCLIDRETLLEVLPDETARCCCAEGPIDNSGRFVGERVVTLILRNACECIVKLCL